VPSVRLKDMPQRLLCAVQGDAIVVAQAIVLKHALKFHQLGEYGVAVHVRNLDDSSTAVAAKARPASAGYAASHIAPAMPNECATPPRLRSAGLHRSLA
jgi:hypothetical protein